MTLAVVTFVGTLGLVLGLYWAFIVRPEVQLRRRVRARLQARNGRPAGAAASIVKASAPTVRPGGIGGRLRRWHREYAVRTTRRLLESAGMRTDPQWLIGGTVVTLVFVVSALGMAEVGWGVAVAAGALTPIVPYAYIRYLASRRLRAFEELFPDAITLMARALRAGHALTSTLALVADEVGEPVRSEFRALSQQHAYGMPFARVMQTFAARIPLVDARFFAAAVVTQRETGGNLARVLDNLAEVMRERARVRRQLHVLTAQGRTTGWFLGAIPILVAVALYVLNPDQMHAFIADPTGMRLLQAAILLELVGLILIRRIVALDY